ncbi:hypothetical protein [Candidatus Nitrosocosmicus franklandus]|uniref:Putative Purine phosphoribosyltransferase (GpT-2) n=1 Tax=Candidatus Nitrosocosmicus franklandianus TaxID=1798806 RepID=A0A484IBU5_9ARCH|nr:hypothetical protein [Candidatus Nitrosocosmicus franklandus]VFJ14560.1 putative Purine phosphoribosyltransferase (GpT-2) [Candidatus Nitrosocosmicus franklandus]
MNYSANRIVFSWEDIEDLIVKISNELNRLLPSCLQDYEIIAIANGGIIPATLLSYKLKIKSINIFPIIDKKVVPHKIPILDSTKKYLLVDEIYDTGKTIEMVEQYMATANYLKIFLLQRYETDTASDYLCGKTLNDPRWVVFPWEEQTI